MERLNAFIVSNKPALGRFYDQIVDHPDHGKLTDLAVRPFPPNPHSLHFSLHLVFARCQHEYATTHSSSCARFWRPTWPAWRPTSRLPAMIATKAMTLPRSCGTCWPRSRHRRLTEFNNSLGRRSQRECNKESPPRLRTTRMRDTKPAVGSFERLFRLAIGRPTGIGGPNQNIHL